jgi:hypothetical protein
MMRPPVRRGCSRRMAKLALAGLSVSVVFGAGAMSAQAASFTITKQVDAVGDQTPFTFHVSFKPQPNDVLPPDFRPPADFQLTGGQSRTFIVHKGFYTVTELAASGWQLVDVRCDNGNDPDPADTPTVDLAQRSATIELSRTEAKSCTFRNAKIPAPPGPTPPGATPPGTTRPVTSGPTPAPTPAQAVNANRIVKSSARIVAPKRCVSRRFTVAVSAGHVKSVSIFVNGHRVRTLRARAGQRRFRVTLPRPLVVARVVARVRFTQKARPRTRTVRATIRRCAPRAVRPQFTG